MLGHRIGALAQTRSQSVKFPTTDDAAWFVLGFLVFAGAAGICAVSILLAGGKVALPLLLPLTALVIAGAAILEFGLRRLQVNLTGRRLSPWPLGFVSLHTIGLAMSPSTMFEAGDRIGMNGKVLAGCVYLLLIADAALLVVITG